MNWYKSSYSGSEGGDCVEVAFVRRHDWHKSSHSGDEGGDCVEVAVDREAIHVRDSKDPEGPILTIPPTAWADFVRRLRA